MQAGVRRKEWDGGFTVGELRGATLGIVGYGCVGGAPSIRIGELQPSRAGCCCCPRRCAALSFGRSVASGSTARTRCFLLSPALPDTHGTATPVPSARSSARRPAFASPPSRLHFTSSPPPSPLKRRSDIGQAAARLARAFGMRVVALRRRPQLSSADSLTDAVYPPEKLTDLMAASDYVLVATPLTPETLGIISAEAIAAMKPDGVLINLGRGPCVDEGALAKCAFCAVCVLRFACRGGECFVGLRALRGGLGWGGARCAAAAAAERAAAGTSPALPCCAARRRATRLSDALTTPLANHRNTLSPPARALSERRIKGAALDVFTVEPLPPDSPLWGLAADPSASNLLISPHCADRTREFQFDTVRRFLGEAGRWAAGQPLENVVDKRAGY